MARAVPEFQGVLTQLAAAAEDKIGVLIPHLDRLDAAERRQFITDAYPTLITPYLAAAGDLTAQWYDEQPTTTRGFRAAAATLAPVGQLAISGRWALTQSNPVAALQGSSTRAVFNSSRRTVLSNVERESGARWARHASANACAFCRMLATRTGVGKGSLYTSKTAAVRTGTTKRKRGKRSAGDKYHDHCHCIAVPVRPGDSYEPAPYVQQWTEDYRAAVRGASKDGEVGPRGTINTTAVVRRMEAAEKDRRTVAAGTGGGGKPPTGKPPVPAAGGAPSGPDPQWMRLSRAHVNGLTGRYRQSVIDYTGEDHRRINGWLRRGQTPDDKWAAARTKDLDAVLAKNPFARTTVLTRTSELSDFGLTSGEGLDGIAGKLRTEHGFMSTTRFPDGGDTKGYKNPVRFAVIAPAGTPAAAIEDLSKFARQGEVLVARGRRIMVVPGSPRYDAEIEMWRATMLIQKEVTR